MLPLIFKNYLEFKIMIGKFIKQVLPLVLEFHFLLFIFFTSLSKSLSKFLSCVTRY